MSDEISPITRKPHYHERMPDALQEIHAVAPVEPPKNTRTLEQGRYRHYKGGIYVVVRWATHTETGEKLVIYQAEHDKASYWARPYEMFLEDVEVEGKMVPRFELIERFEF